MTPLNPYFLNGSPSEQRLVQDLVNEQLRMYGQDVVYIPRKFIGEKTVIKETIVSKFDDSFRLEAYITNFEGFGGSGDILSKFGVRTTDEITLIISKERYEDFISPFLVNNPDIKVALRPQEGDLIYFPLDNTLFEIKYVEGKRPFYQLNNLYVYELRCEVFEYEDEIIDTSIEEVDKSVQDFGHIVTIRMVNPQSAVPASAYALLASEMNNSVPNYSVQYIDLINDGSGYLSPPNITISSPVGGGITATAVAIMTSRPGRSSFSIDRILIINPGIGYTQIPKVTIRSSTGSGAIATAGISTGVLGPMIINENGVGYSTTPIVSIGMPAVNGVGASVIATLNSYGSLSQLRYVNAGSGYTAAQNISIPSPIGISTGNYKFNEMVRGVSTGTSAYVKEWDYDTKILKVSITNGNFALGETIVGMGTLLGGSNSAYKVLSIDSYNLYDPYSENKDIEEEATQILDFTEKNPFGNF